VKGSNVSNLSITEIKAFVPSKNFGLSKQFYQDLGFTMASDDDGIAYCVPLVSWRSMASESPQSSFNHGVCVIFVFSTLPVFCGASVKMSSSL